MCHNYWSDVGWLFRVWAVSISWILCLERGRARFRLQLQGLTPEVSVRFTVAEQARKSFPQSLPLTLLMHRQNIAASVQEEALRLCSLRSSRSCHWGSLMNDNHSFHSNITVFPLLPIFLSNPWSLFQSFLFTFRFTSRWDHLSRTVWAQTVSFSDLIRFSAFFPPPHGWSHLLCNHSLWFPQNSVSSYFSNVAVFFIINSFIFWCWSVLLSQLHKSHFTIH